MEVTFLADVIPKEINVLLENCLDVYTELPLDTARKGNILNDLNNSLLCHSLMLKIRNFPNLISLFFVLSFLFFTPTKTEMIAAKIPPTAPEIIVVVFLQIQGSSTLLWHSGTSLQGTANIVLVGSQIL